MRLLMLMTSLMSLFQVSAQITDSGFPSIVNNRVGNGGAAAAVEISYIARNISTYWEDACHKYPSDKSLRCELVADYKKLWEPNSPLKVSVISDNSTTASDGSQRDLYNDGVKEIIFNDQEWQKVKERYHKIGASYLVGVIFHEFVTILGEEEGDNYTTSMNIISELSAYGYDFGSVVIGEFLPKRCSTNTQSNDGDFHMPTARARFDVEVNFSCQKRGLNRTCSIDYTRVDNFIPSQIIKSQRTIKRKFVSEKNLKEQLMEQISIQDESCI